MDKKKIVIIGPVYPFKGGIAHYTGLMSKALSKKYEVVTVSFKMQYPKLLFKKEQRDYGNKTFAIEDTRYWINTANPFNLISTAKRIKQLEPDLIIAQWWHPYFAPCYQILFNHLNGIKKLFICHNVLPHERFVLDRLLTRTTLKKADYVIVNSKLDEADLVKLLPDMEYRRTVHPTYQAFKLTNIGKNDARKLLGIAEDTKVLLFFGLVRKYKGLKYLIEAMPEITEKIKNVCLYVVGDFGDSKDEYLKLIEECKVLDSIVIKDGYVPDKEVEPYFAAADLNVCPYVSATQSGIIQIAYGFELPVIATNVGGLPETVTDGKTGYIVEPENSHEIAKAVIKYFTENKEEEFRNEVNKESYRFSWERCVEVIEELWRE